MEDILSKALRQFAALSITQFIFMTIVPAVIYTVYLVIQNRLKNKNIAVADIIPVYCFIIYVNVILQLTFMGRTDGSRIGIELTPFIYLKSGGVSYSKSLAIVYSVLNVLLFVPYGFIVAWMPFLRKRKHRISICITLLISLATSLIIELLQLSAGRGYYEAEDLICNTFGGLVGATFFCIVYEYIFSDRKL